MSVEVRRVTIIKGIRCEFDESGSGIKRDDEGNVLCKRGGRKRGSGIYGEPTTVIRVPLSFVPVAAELLKDFRK